MTERARLEGMATIVPIPDLSDGIAFYADIMGFDLVYRVDDGYALMARGGAGIMLLGAEQGARLATEARNIAAYVWVNDLAAYFAEIAARLKTLPSDRWCGIYPRPNGVQEFFAIDPVGTRLYFGQNGP